MSYKLNVGAMEIYKNGELTDIDMIVGEASEIKQILDDAKEEVVTILDNIPTDYTELSNSVDAVMANIGNIKSVSELLNPADMEYAVGAITGDVGEQITLKNTTNYSYVIFDNVKHGEVYDISTEQTDGTNYKFYIIGTDENDIIVSRYAPIGEAYSILNDVVTITSEKKLYIMCRGKNITTNNNVKILLGNKSIDLQTQINNSDYKFQSLSDANLKNTTLMNNFMSNISNNIQRTASVIADEVLNSAYAVINRHKAENKDLIRFSFITDVHMGGNRTPNYDPSQNIRQYIALSNKYADFAINAGDTITNYYDPVYMPDMNAIRSALLAQKSRYSSLCVPYLLAKGNHDSGLKGYTEIATPSSFVANKQYVLDNETGTYYVVRNESEFNKCILEQKQFYSENTSMISNQEYHECCLEGVSPAGAVFGETYGGYYYVDIKGIRVIVMNEYYVISETSHGVNNAQSQFVQNAMSDALSNNIPVMTISHYSKAAVDLQGVINEFITNGGVYIGHIHGHEHSDICISKRGFNNIGVNWGCISNQDVMSHNCLSFNLFEIDLQNKILYEIRVGAWVNRIDDDNRTISPRSEYRIFDFGKQIQLV